MYVCLMSYTQITIGSSNVNKSLFHIITDLMKMDIDTHRINKNEYKHVLYCICSNFCQRNADLQRRLEVKSAVEPSLTNK